MREGVGACTHGDEELGGDQRRWKENGEQEIAAKNGVGEQSLR